jgi:hypothetical protein
VVTARGADGFASIGLNSFGIIETLRIAGGNIYAPDGIGAFSDITPLSKPVISKLNIDNGMIDTGEKGIKPTNDAYLAAETVEEQVNYSDGTKLPDAQHPRKKKATNPGLNNEPKSFHPTDIKHTDGHIILAEHKHVSFGQFVYVGYVLEFSDNTLDDISGLTIAVDKEIYYEPYQHANRLTSGNLKQLYIGTQNNRLLEKLKNGSKVRVYSDPQLTQLLYEESSRKDFGQGTKITLSTAINVNVTNNYDLRCDVLYRNATLSPNAQGNVEFLYDKNEEVKLSVDMTNAQPEEGYVLIDRLTNNRYYTDEDGMTVINPFKDKKSRYELQIEKYERKPFNLSLLNVNLLDKKNIFNERYDVSTYTPGDVISLQINIPENKTEYGNLLRVKINGRDFYEKLDPVDFDRQSGWLHIQTNNTVVNDLVVEICHIAKFTCTREFTDIKYHYYGHKYNINKFGVRDDRPTPFYGYLNPGDVILPGGILTVVYTLNKEKKQHLKYNVSNNGNDFLIDDSNWVLTIENFSDPVIDISCDAGRFYKVEKQVINQIINAEAALPDEMSVSFDYSEYDAAAPARNFLTGGVRKIYASLNYLTTYSNVKPEFLWYINDYLVGKSFEPVIELTYDVREDITLLCVVRYWCRLDVNFNDNDNRALRLMYKVNGEPAHLFSTDVPLLSELEVELVGDNTDDYALYCRNLQSIASPDDPHFLGFVNITQNTTLDIIAKRIVSEGDPDWSSCQDCVRLVTEDDPETTETTGVYQVKGSNIYRSGDYLYNRHAEEISVYNVSGLLIYKGNEPEVKLPKGVFVVKSRSGWVRKI